MSSFIVSEDCMNTIINGIKNYPPYHSTLRHKDASELAKELYTFNAAAFTRRYAHKLDNTTLNSCIPDYTFKQGNHSQQAVYKAVQCFLYQCAEFNETPQEYKVLEDELNAFLAHISYDIISELEYYKLAPWG